MRNRRCRAWLLPIVITAVFTALAVPASGATRAASGSGSHPTNVDITKNPKWRYGEPEIAVNPKNPDNVVYAVLAMGTTFACQKQKRHGCDLVNSAYGPQPKGLMNDFPDFSHVEVYSSFDAGKTWKKSKAVPAYPPGHSDLVERGDPLLTASPNGVFHLGWDDIHFADLPKTILRDAGIAASSSKDGGQTWSVPVLTGTPVDRPFFATDLSTGTIYEASSGVAGGPNSTGDASLPPEPLVSPDGDRLLVSSKDGVHWSTPQRFGGVAAFPPGASMSAARGALATAFNASKPELCAGAESCTVFQTTTDAGVNWTRHVVPVPADASGATLVAADPSKADHFAVAKATGTEFLVYETHDAGTTWTGPVTVTEDTTKVHFHPWLAYSPKGVLGLMWQTNVETSPAPTTGGLAAAIPESLLESLPEPVREAVEAGETVPESALSALPESVREAVEAQASGAPSPYNVWAAISKDGGASFSAPLEVSTADSPAPQPFLPYGIGDDFSHLAMSDKYAFVGWADYRPGERSGFFAAVPLSMFTK